MPSSSPLNFSLFFLSFFFSLTVLFLLPTATWKASYSPQNLPVESLCSHNSVHSISSSPPKTSLPNTFSSTHSHFFFFQNLHSTHSLKSRKISRLTSSAHSSLSLKMAFSKQLPHPLTLVHSSFFFFLSAPATWIFSALHLKWPAVHLLSNKPKKKTSCLSATCHHCREYPSPVLTNLLLPTKIVSPLSSPKRAPKR